MSWKPIDFQGIVSLDRPLVDQLEAYLNEKETQLSKAIIGSVHPAPGESLPTPKYSKSNEYIKLSDAIDKFTRKVRRVTEGRRSMVHSDDWKSAAQQINQALWVYVEILEGGVTELFQQLGQVGFEDWHFELLQVVEMIKDILQHHMEDVEWAIKRLEKRLWEYRWALQAKEGKNIWISKIFSFWKSMLDRSLMSYIQKSEKFLKIRFKSFTTRYEEYFKLNNKIELSLKKFKKYQVLSTLESASQEVFKKVYGLIKLWRINQKSDSLPEREVIRAIRGSFSTEKVYHVFREYFQGMEESLFERSRILKKNTRSMFLGDVAKPLVDDVIAGYRVELHILGATVSKYREFLLRTHPNPYVRTRWGFSELIVGPEPAQTKQLRDLIYEIEEVDHLFEDLKHSLDRAAEGDSEVILRLQQEDIERTLHEMGQPLTSRSAMRSRAERLIEQLNALDELGTFEPDVVVYMGNILSKAIRIDWQYQSLFELSAFHKLYRIHKGIVGPLDDRKHMNRINKFKVLIHQIETWVKNRESQRHIHEIELDMNDMKGYLQDFLAEVQRALSQEDLDDVSLQDVCEDLSRKLLEYRYLFGNFFFHLQEYEPEGKLIRNQFLFVDQYFESVESRLSQATSEAV